MVARDCNGMPLGPASSAQRSPAGSHSGGEATTRTLRLGVLTGSGSIPDWLKEVTDAAALEGKAEVALIMDTGPVDVQGTSSPGKFVAPRRASDLYLALEDLLFAPKPDPQALHSLDELLPGVATVQIPSGPGAEVDPQALETIRSLALDVILDSGQSPVPASALGLARHGLWSCHVRTATPSHEGTTAPDTPDASAPPNWGEGIAEVARESPDTKVILWRVMGDPPEPFEIATSRFATDPVSARRNQTRYLYDASALMTQALHRLSAFGDPRPARSLGRSDPVARAPQPSPATGTSFGATVCRSARLALRSVARKSRAATTRDQWQLVVLPGNGGPAFRPRSGLRRLVPPRDRFWADPHILRHQDRAYIFFEEYPYRTGRGHISVVEMDPDGRISPPRMVLQRGYHLSYPFVFRHGDDIYMVPETSENETVELYRATDFPDAWTLERILLHGVRGVDATLEFRDDRWWMFMGMRTNPHAKTSDTLHLYHTHDLLSGAWTPHPWNPILSDAQGARPAGRLFTVDGVLYRPGQQGIPTYGSGVILHEVTRLSPDEYEEHPVETIAPGWEPDIIGTHTLSVGPALTVLDAKVRRRRLP